jgi:hypothetical protein
MAIKIYKKHHEDINMGRVNLCWGLAPNQDATSNISHKTMVIFGQGGKTKTCMLVYNSINIKRCANIASATSTI